MSYPEGNDFGIYGPEEQFVNPGTATNYTNGGYNGGVQGGMRGGAGGGSGGGGGFAGAMIGRRVFSLGMREYREVSNDRDAESQAAQTGDVRAYQKAQADEYSGFFGSIRHGIQTAYAQHTNMVNRENGIKGHVDTPDEQAMELQLQADDERQQKFDTQQGKEGKRNQEQYRAEFARQQAELTDATAPDAVSRRRGQIDRQAADQAAQAQSLLDFNYKEEGFQSAADRNAFVAKSTSLAGQRAQAEQMALTMEQASQAKGMNAQVDEITKRMGGDTQGAERAALEERIRKRSEEEHKKSGDLGDKYDRDVAPAERAELAKKQADERKDLEEKTQDEITNISARAAESRLRANGDILGAEKAAKFAAIDSELAKTKEAYDAETDSAKKSSLGKILAAQQAAAVQEKIDIETIQRQERAKATVEAAARTAEQALRFAGRGDEAEKMQAEQEADAQRRAGLIDPAVIQATLDEREKEIAYHKQEVQHRTDFEESQSEARSKGQSALADYEGLEERENERIRQAEMTGDKSKIAQAQRIATNDIKAWELEHRKRGQMFGSTEEFSNHLMFLGQDDGMGAAMNKAKGDLSTLGRHGNIGVGTHDGRSDLDKSAKDLSISTDKLKQLFDNAKQLWVLPR